MRPSLGRPIIVENIGAADGSIAVGRAARAAPDGYTLSIGNVATHVLNGAAYPLSYDLLNDFEAISRLTDAPRLYRCEDFVTCKGPAGIDCLAESQSGQGVGGRVCHLEPFVWR